MDYDRDEWRYGNVGRVLHNALLRFESRVFSLLAEEGHDQIRQSHLSLTRNLDVNGTRTIDLARRANMTKQAMGELVVQCETLGLVRRIPDQRDARAKIVLFTAPGLDWLKSFRAALSQAEDEMRLEIGTQCVEGIVAALTSYGKGFEQLKHDASTVKRARSGPDKRIPSR